MIAILRGAWRRRSTSAALIVAVGLALVASMRVISTYGVFSNTMDEPQHITAGLEWIERGTLKFGGEHPPLGRIAAAVGPYLAGVRLGAEHYYPTLWRQILYENGAYVQNLKLARLGMLVFLLVAIAGVFVWTSRLYGQAAALVAVALFTTTPVVLAHSGLATTDIPLVATMTWAIPALILFFERPSARRGALLGLAAGLALVSKMSAVLFLPAAGAAVLITRWLFARARASEQPPTARFQTERYLLVAAVVAFGVIWAMYRFSIGRRLGSLIPGGIVLLAPEYFQALGIITLHNAAGHPGYLLGQFGTTGWWYFFPVALAVKTPIPLIVLTGIGIVAAVRHARATREWQSVAPIAAAAAIVLVSLRASINIGVRHVLPIYPLLAMTAAYGSLWLWTRTRQRLAARGLVVAMIGWQIVSSTRIHPDYLSYFNELAGRHPERILLDSDLDWGQDLLRLADTVRVRRIPALSLAYFGSADPARLMPPTTHLLAPGERATGWIAASETFLNNPNPDFAGYKWMRELTPVARVGTSIKLFYVPPVGSSP